MEYRNIDIKQVYKDKKDLKRQLKSLQEIETAYYSQISCREHFPELDLMKQLLMGAIQLKDLDSTLNEYIKSKPIEWWDNIKNYKILPFMKGELSRFINSLKNDRGYRMLISEGGMSTLELKNCKTTNSFLRKLKQHSFVLRKIKTLEDELNNFKVEATIKIDTLEIKLDILTEGNKLKLDSKCVARAMRDKGLTIIQIAKSLNVSESTVKRWLKN